MQVRIVYKTVPIVQKLDTNFPGIVKIYNLNNCDANEVVHLYLKMKSSECFFSENSNMSSCGQSKHRAIQNV